MQTSETQLVKRIQKRGDRAAADALVRAYYGEIHRFASRQIPSDPAAALDLTQEIFISMLKTLHRYDPGKGAGFRTWLYRIAANKAVDRFRAQSHSAPETLFLDEVEPIDETDFTKRLENKEFAGKIRASLAARPTDAQKIFRLHVYAQHTFAEIAQALQIPENTAKTKYYRLINALRKEFNGHYE